MDFHTTILLRYDRTVGGTKCEFGLIDGVADHAELRVGRAIDSRNHCVVVVSSI